MIAGSLIPVLMAAMLAQDAQMVREGAYWKRTYSGTFNAPPAKMLRVSTRGHVIVRGTQGELITYKLTEQVRARSQEDAHHRFGSDITGMTVRGGVAIVTLMPVIREDVNAQWEVSVPKRMTMVMIDSQMGDAEAYDLDGSLHVETVAGLIRCDRIRGGVEATTGGGEIRMGRIGGPSRCVSAAGSIFVDFAGGEATCQTAGGEIQIREASGPLALSTEGGNIQVDKCASSVQAHTGAGVIQIAQAGGIVSADTRGGSIEVGSSHGASCQSAAGTIRVKTASGPLHIQTAMGSILAEVLSGAHLENSSLVAGSGDITVLIPSNLALSVMARNESDGSPRILSDFSEVRARSAAPGHPPVVYEGAINGGGPMLTINTAGGIIYVRKLK